MASTQTTLAPTVPGLLTRPAGKGILSWITTVDHKRLGMLYILSSFLFMSAAAVEAFLIRLQLLTPEMSVVNPDSCRCSGPDRMSLMASNRMVCA